MEEVSQVLMIEKVKMLSPRHNGLNPLLLSDFLEVGVYSISVKP